MEKNKQLWCSEKRNPAVFNNGYHDISPLLNDFFFIIWKQLYIQPNEADKWKKLIK